MYPFATEEGPFGAETFCQVKLSTTCLTLKNQQIPIYRHSNESLLYQIEQSGKNSDHFTLLANQMYLP